MAKVLGLDLGTNSLGWALVDESENEYTLIDKGVDIFQEGVARDKNNEKPAVQDRTSARALRRHYFRRRLRKIELLKILNLLISDAAMYPLPDAGAPISEITNFLFIITSCLVCHTFL